MKKRDWLERYRISDGKDFRLKRISPDDTWKLRSKEEALDSLGAGVKLLSELQAKLYAQNQWALLLIFQAMDAAGKDGTISHVMSGVNPQGCQVYSFKAPSSEELSHDFLWRTTRCLPERGRIGIFNRSYYEEVLVVRVHPEMLAHERLPAPLVTPHLWGERFEDINAYERHLSRSGIKILKFFLHLSRKEQRRRFLSRLEEPDKNWKFSAADIQERRYWDDYMNAYEELISRTATAHAPWHVVPADHKWFTRLVVAETIIEALESLKLEYPVVEASKRKELAAIQKQLLSNHSM